ncbi:MAG: hypothetical protein ACTSQQ_13685, partial [Candidatus Helarchaeota archaeon]
MNTIKKEKDVLSDVQEVEQNFGLREAIDAKHRPQTITTLFEKLGFTTSINTELKEIQKNGNIRILSPFSHVQRIPALPQLDNMGLASTSIQN